QFYPESSELLKQTLGEAEASGAEAQCELHSKPLREGAQAIWTNTRLRFLGRNEGASIFYLTFEDITGRRELDSVRQRLDEIVRNVPAGISIYEQRGEGIYPLFISDRVCEMFGFEREEYDRRIAEGLPVNYMPSKEFLQRSDESDSRVDLVFPARRRDGSWFWLRVYGSLVTDEKGRNLLYATLFDVTAQKRMEESLEKSDLRAQALIANAPGGVIAVAVRGGKESCEYVSEGVAQLLGCSYEEAERAFSEDIYAVIHPEDRERVKKRAGAAVASASAFNEHYRVLRADGSSLWVNLTANPVKGSDGVLRYYCVFTDISEQMKISESLRLQQQKTNAALQLANIAVWELDIPNRRLIMLNKAQNSTLPDIIENVPEAFREQGFVDASSLEDYIALHERVMAGEESASGTFLMSLPADGSLSWMNVSYHTFYSEGRPVSAIGSAVNADAEVQSRMHAREAELAMESSSLYFWIYDYRTGVHEARNQNAKRFDLTDPSHQLGLAGPGYDNILPDSHEELARFVARLRSGEIRGGTLTLHLNSVATGIEWFKIHCETIPGSDGEPAVLTIVGEDVSEQLRRERDYATALKNLESVRDSAVIARVQANLTRDSFVSWDSEFSRESAGYSEGLELLAEKTVTEGQRERLRAALGRESLLEAFMKGESGCTVLYQVISNDSERPLWRKTAASVYRDPASGDIMTFQYTYDVDDEISMSAIAGALKENVYELIALIYPSSGLIHYYSHGPVKDLGDFTQKDYHIDTGRLSQRFIASEYRERAAEQLSLSTILKRLETEGTYTVVLPVEYEGRRYWKKWGFFWLGEDKSAIIMICADVTSLEDLRAVNADMRFALQSNDIVICHYDAKKRSLRLPEAFAVSAGLPALIENLTYSAPGAVAGDAEAYARFCDRILAGEKEGESTLQFTLPGGRTVWKRCAFRTSFDEEGALEGAVITIRDITEQLERDIESQRNRILIEQNNIAIIDYDYIGDVLHFEANRAGKGYVKKAFPGYYEHIAVSGEATPEGAEAIRALIRDTRERPSKGVLDYQADIWGTGYRWVRLHYTTLADEAGRVYRLIGQVQDIEEEREREALLAELSSRIGSDMPAFTYEPTIISQIFQFLHGSSDMDDAIGRVLALLGEHYGVSRAYICEDDAANTVSTNTFEWCAEGIEPQKDKLQNVAYDELDGVYAELFDERGICLCPDIRALPDAIRKHLEAQNIKGLIMCNILDKGRRFGMVGFDDCTGKTAWTEELKGTLALSSIILGTFLIKLRQQKNAALSEDFLAALDDNAAYIYVINPNTHEMIYVNRALRSRFKDAPLGSICYEAAVGLDKPCENCSVRKLMESGVSEPVEVLRKDGLWMLTQASRINWDGLDAYMVACTDITEQKKLEEALRVSGMELRALTNSVPGGIIMYGYEDGRLSMQYFNDTLCRITGYSREEYQRMAEADPWVLVFPEDIEPLARALGELLATGKPLEHEYRIQTAGGFCWIHITAEIVERTGDRFKLVAVLVDISERKRAEAEARFHNYCLNQVDSALSAGTVINGLGLHAPLYHVSENIERLLGYSIEEFKSMYAEQYESIIHPDDYIRVLELNNKYAEEQPEYFEMEFRFVRKDGSVFWTLEKATKLNDFQGEIAYLSVFVDISQQKDILEQINMQEEAYRIAVAHSNSLVYRFDIASKTIYMPPDVAASYELPSLMEDVPHGVVAAGYIAPESIEAYVDFYQSISEGIDGKTVEIRRLLSDGKFHWFKGAYNIIRNENGAPKSAIVTFTNVEEQKDKDAQITLLKETEQLLKIIARNTQNRIIIYDFATDTLRPYDMDAGLSAEADSKAYRTRDFFSEERAAPECLEQLKEEYRKLRAGASEGGLKCRMKLSDGVWRWYNGFFTTIFDSAGKPIYSILSIEDITDEYENELTFQRYQNMLVAMDVAASYYLEYNLTHDSLEEH
ncbi:MAG: PAS domain S-box protein, partial [Oscillospiraceae bacterium]|nr:PAS domain S-box protein [Oscillospiraceae bacterium]